ncbi:winged helix DNA-binding domain-containing protein [Rhodococcus sp. NPDC058532]|uniref:winged helix DNA-binding domain-containing protein n=1 Tax=Rhodococcus sp. NPDC058532 TaxID=3346540 RepID=UPI00365A7D02
MRTTLGIRALGRATLARQHLLERATDSTETAIRHLYGLQAQSPAAPYFALWSRIDGFRTDDLARLIEDRSVVRITVMRGTVHAVTAADAGELRPWVQPIMDGDLRTNAQHAKALVGCDTAAVAAHARELLDATPMTLAALRPHLASRWPDRDPAALAHAVRDLLPLVQVPPRGLWGRSGQPVCTTLQHWAGEPLAEPDPERILQRYLAAYGPASVADAQAWSGLTRLGEVFERMRPRLRVFADVDGAELFDLPDAPRPGADAPAPVRILAPYDSMLLSHADRTRVVDDGFRRVLFTVNGIVKPAVLVDGRVAGYLAPSVSKGAAVVDVTLLQTLSRTLLRDVEAEALRLLRFTHPSACSHEVRVTAAR